MCDASPPLSQQHLASLQALTRDYARLSRSGAGLGKVLGGFFLLALAVVELAGHHGRPTFLGGFAPLPVTSILALGLLPFLWLAAREVMGRWWYRRHGDVVPSAGEFSTGRARRLRIAGILLPVLLLCCLVPILAGSLPWKGLRVALVLGLALGLSLAWRRLQDRGRLERFMGILLFTGPILMFSGIQMAAGDTLLAFPAAGIAAIIMGLREHLAFRRVERELAGER